MSKRKAEIEPLMSDAAPAPAAAAETAPSAAAPPVKRDYRFQTRGNLFGQQFITILGIAGGEEEARKELHRWVDASIVGIEANPIRDAKTLVDVRKGAAVFNDGDSLLLPARSTVEIETDKDGNLAAWKVSANDKTRVWRPGFSFHRVRAEIEQLKIIHKQTEVPKTRLVGGPALVGAK